LTASSMQFELRSCRRDWAATSRFFVRPLMPGGAGLLADPGAAPAPRARRDALTLVGRIFWRRAEDRRDAPPLGLAQRGAPNNHAAAEAVNTREIPRSSGFGVAKRSR